MFERKENNQPQCCSDSTPATNCGCQCGPQSETNNTQQGCCGAAGTPSCC